MKTNKPKLKTIDKNRTQHSNKSIACSEYCTRHEDIENMFIM